MSDHVKCNMCDWTGVDGDLIRRADAKDGGTADTCPNCGTDHYLMDTEEEDDGDDVIHISDRFGYPIHENSPLAQETCDRMCGLMVGEECFIAMKRDVPGILIEFEFDDDCEPTDHDRAAVAQLAAAWPWVEFTIEQGDHIFMGRHAIRAFVPEKPLTRRAVKDITERLWHTLY